MTAAAPRSAAQDRIVTAALELFAEHGVGGTSLQMIADSIGVTKAAVYHQFPTKEEIVVAVAEDELARVAAALDEAEAEPDEARARDVLVTRIVDLAVERRHMESTLVGDPVIVRFFETHEPFRHVMGRLYRVLMGPDAGPDTRASRPPCSRPPSGAPPCTPSSSISTTTRCANSSRASPGGSSTCRTEPTTRAQRIRPSPSWQCGPPQCSTIWPSRMRRIAVPLISTGSPEAGTSKNAVAGVRALHRPVGDDEVVLLDDAGSR